MDSESEMHPLNLNSVNFDSEAFVNNLIHKKGLDELVAVEEDMVQNVRRLDSEMQQLVYENYNKFLTATNTVRNMQNVFTEMDNKMRKLSGQMEDLSTLSHSLSENFNRNRKNIHQLNETSKTLQRLQYICQLPQILQSLISKQEFKKAISTFINVKPKLEKYANVKSISGIYNEALEIIKNLELKFREKLTVKLNSSEDLCEAVELLIILGIPKNDLKNELLANWRKQLKNEIEILHEQIESDKIYSDILEFVDMGGCNFLTNLSLAVSLYEQLFPESQKLELIKMAEDLMNELEKIMNRRFELETNSRDCALFVKALDRISRKIAVFLRLLPKHEFSRINSNVVVSAVRHKIDSCKINIKLTNIDLFNETLKSIMENKSENNSKINSMKKFSNDLINKLEQNFLITIKTCLANLLLFTANDINFSNIDHAYFSTKFGVEIHENILIGSVHDLKTIAENLENEYFQIEHKNSIFYLIFANFLMNLQNKHFAYLMNLCQEQFKLTEQKSASITNLDELTKLLKNIIEITLKNYIKLQCEFLQKKVSESIENFDWENCQETTKSVQINIKDLFKSIEAIEHELSLFMDNDKKQKKESTPDSMRGGARRAASSTSNTYETASIGSTSIMEKLWNDEVTEDSLSNNSGGLGAEHLIANILVDFKRDSMLTNIVKICLKSMADSVRKHRFSTNGLQQLQVDCGYLKHCLWKLLIDEHILNSSIEEIVTLAVGQCLEPKLLEPTAVREICERN